MKKKIISLIAVLVLVVTMSGCAVESYLNDVKGQLVGNAFDCIFYDYFGNKSLTVSGTKIGMSGNVVEEATVDSDTGTKSTSYGLSSVITIDIDGHEMQSCGDTIIFQETGLEPDADFILDDIQSSSTGNISENTSVSGIVNQYKNFFGKPQVVVIKSQLGIPICAYSGDDVYAEVRDDLPKTTKLMIDGKALYIHRATFQIIDRDLIK